MSLSNRKPRGKSIYKSNAGTSQMYKFYCFKYFKEKVDNRIKVYTKSKYNITAGQYNTIVEAINKLVGEEIVYDGLELTLPCRLGVIGLKKRKHKLWIDKPTGRAAGYPVNLKETKDLWDRDPQAKAKKQYVFFTNEHTNQNMYRISYDRKNAHFTYKKVYRFKPCRYLNRELAKVLKDNKLNIDAYYA